MAATLTRDCLFVTGPTAAGKTAIGLELARRIGGEIISLDSMAVYRGLDIGTAKPNPEERDSAGHHLLDLVDPADSFSVADYLVAAERAVAEIRRRGAEPIFVGGTPLYLKALLRGIFEGPPADWDFRRQQQAWGEKAGPGALHARLAEIDPVSAARLHERDTRRIIRALEVWAKTGRTMSDWQQQFNQGRPAQACRVFVIDWPREELQRRIDARVDAMFAAGLVEEVRSLLAAEHGIGRTAAQALGYREVMAHLRGDADLPATIALVKTRTRQFAKRQMTWFRSLSECRWLSASEPLDTVRVADEICRTMSEPGSVDAQTDRATTRAIERQARL